LTLKFQDSLANVRRAEATFTSDVLKNGLACGSLSETANRLREVLAETRLPSTVLAAHSGEPEGATLVAANSVSVRKRTGSHLSHRDKEWVGN
jgi:hypothetical protein